MIFNHRRLRTLFVAGVMLATAIVVRAESVADRVETTKDFQLTVRGDRLAFATVADYKRAVDQPSDETQRQFIHEVSLLKGFTSFAKKQNPSPTLKGNPSKIAALVQEEYFAAILNPDLTVQIGDYIYRVNPTSEQVYVLPAADEKEIRDLLSENTRNPHVRAFSAGDNVLELVEAKGAQAKSLFCHESGIGGYHSEASTGALTASADFIRYGIYFTLFASVSPYGSSGFAASYAFDFTGGITANKGYVYYHVRCGQTVSYAITSGGNWEAIVQKYHSYQGSTNLNEVYFFYRLKSKPSGQYLTPYVGFRVNK